MFKITISKPDSNGVDKIIDVKICETRPEAELFIKKCKALPKEYKQENQVSYVMSHN